MSGDLFGSPVSGLEHVGHVLDAKHYLGTMRKAHVVWDSAEGVVVLTNPAARRLPQQSWLELSRWCLYGAPNAGSRQWAAVARHLYRELPQVTTVVSYSDPGVGHTGALYRACNWLWAPTWHRLRPPPSGNGDWGNGRQRGVKDRWVYPIRPDAERAAILALSDDGLRERAPWAEYREPTWRGMRRTGGGGDYRRWTRECAAEVRA